MTSPHRPKVLHVDDSRTARHLIREILHEAGFEVVEAGTGKEALALAADLPDLILLDINLPDMSGLEVCRKLRADPTTAAIPIWSAPPTSSAAANCRAIIDPPCGPFSTAPPYAFPEIHCLSRDHATPLLGA